ncbi:hypothetical protein FRB96_001311 [Tulasnella sp. 330]|nr:hypothetical protein FRB96_001311 [Tulasnella sp. 330]
MLRNLNLMNAPLASTLEISRLRSGSGYSPISAHLDDDDHHHPQHTSSSSSSFFPVTSSYAHRINSDADLEMAESRSPSTVWDREMSSRDKTRKIMTGSDTLTATSFSSTHRPRSSQRPSAQSINSNGNYQTSPIIHRRQSSMVSNTDTVTTTTTTKALRPTYHHRSGSSLQNFGAGPGRRGSPIDTNGSVGARRPLFRIGGTSGEEESGTTTTSDSD